MRQYDGLVDCLVKTVKSDGLRGVRRGSKVVLESKTVKSDGYLLLSGPRLGLSSGECVCERVRARVLKSV